MFKKYFSSVLSNKNYDNYVFGLYLILLLGFLVRVIGINYNTAFNDEAIYVVIGKMGLFANDWWSYGAKLWMAGLPYIYPPMSALSYELGGLLGARLLNIIFGVILIEEVYRFVKLMNLYDEKTNKTAAIIAAFLVAFSGIGIFVSKLATYDMPSFLLLMVGINSFLKAENFKNGKYYFLAFFCLFAAFLTKIVIAIFFPFLFIFSILLIRSRPKEDIKKAIAYLYVPFFIACILYFILYNDNLMAYVSNHKELGRGNYSAILDLIWEITQILAVLSIPAGLIFLVTKKFKVFIALILLSLSIPLFHLYFMRLATLDKHLYLTIIFLSVIVAYTAAAAIFNKSALIRVITKSLIPIVVIIYLLSSMQIMQEKETEWNNTARLQEFLRSKIQPEDRVLTEEGGVIILALYDKIFPPAQIVTFDWIDYAGKQDNDGYYQAIQDGYSDLIEIDKDGGDDSEFKQNIHKNLKANYQLVYKDGDFLVYENKNN